MFKKFKTMKWIILFLSVSAGVMLFSGCPETLPPVAGSVSLSLSLSGNAGGEPYVKQVSFSADTSTVEVAVNSALSSVTVELTSELSGASLSVSGQALTSSSSINIDLPYGTTTVAVVVTPDEGDAVSYTLKITRPEPVYSDNADLTAMELSVGYLDPEFASSVISYETSVPDDTESITVTAALSDSAASMSVNGSAAVSGDESGPIALVTGSNIISVKVTAEDGETVKTYTVDVERRAEADAVAPVLSLLGEDPMTVAYEGVFTDPGATAVDNADGTWTVYSADEVDTSVAGDYVLNYDAADLDGNAAVTVTRTVTVLEPPELSTLYLYTGHPSVLGYGRIEVTASLFGLYTQDDVTVFEAAVVEYDNDANYFIAEYGAGAYQRHFWTEDSTDVYTVISYDPVSDISTSRTNTDIQVTETWYADTDKTVPRLILQGDNPFELTGGESFDDPGVLVKDWGITSDTYVYASDLDGLEPESASEGEYTLTYSYTDADGNTAAEVTRTVTVVDDPIELPDLYFYYPGSGYMMHDMTGADYESIMNDSTPVGSGTFLEWDNDLNDSVAYSDYTGLFYRITWTEPSVGILELSESAGYENIEDARTAAVDDLVLDCYTSAGIVPPVLVLNGSDEVALNVGDSFSDPGAAVYDWGEPDDAVTASDYGGLNTSLAVSGTYTLTYTKSDTDGNSAAPVYRTVIVGSGTAEIIIQ